MRNYQPKKNNAYILPHNLYTQTLYLIKDYDRLKREYTDKMDETPFNDGQPRGTDISDPTAQKAIQLDSIGERVRAVERSLTIIPIEYRSYVLNNVMYGIRFPDFANRNTWSIHRCRFIYHVAKFMKWA